MNALGLSCLNPAWVLQQFSIPDFLDDILNVQDTELLSTSPTRGPAYLMTDFNEQRALAGLQKLESQSIGAIYDQYFPEIYRYVRYRINDEAIAEDIASDVFVRLMEASQKNKGPQTNLHGWLIATASNAVNDHHRRHYRRPVEGLSDSMPDGGRKRPFTSGRTRAKPSGAGRDFPTHRGAAACSRPAFRTGIFHRGDCNST